MERSLGRNFFTSFRIFSDLFTSSGHESFVSDRFSPFRSPGKTAPGLSGFPVFWEEGSQLALLHGGQPTEHVGEVLGGIDAAALAAHDD